MKFSAFSRLARVSLSSVDLGWWFQRSGQQQQQQLGTSQMCKLPGTHHRHTGWNGAKLPPLYAGKFKKYEKGGVQFHSGLRFFKNPNPLTVDEGLDENNVQWLKHNLCHLAWIWNHGGDTEEGMRDPECGWFHPAVVPNGRKKTSWTPAFTSHSLLTGTHCDQFALCLHTSPCFPSIMDNISTNSESE